MGWEWFARWFGDVQRFEVEGDRFMLLGWPPTFWSYVEFVVLAVLVVHPSIACGSLAAKHPYSLNFDWGRLVLLRRPILHGMHLQYNKTYLRLWLYSYGLQARASHV